MGNLYNLARMTTSTVGTGTITLGAAAPSFLTFAQAGAQDNEEISYAIEEGSNAREMGRGIYNAAAQTLTRNVLRSTNGNNPIVLDGKAQVFITPSAEDLVAPKDSVYGRFNGKWIEVPVVVDTLPSNPAPNTLWWNAATGKLFLWYKDNAGSQWVEVTSSGPRGVQGPPGPDGPTGDTGPPAIVSSPTPPADPEHDNLWWDSTIGALFMWFNSQWVEVTSAGPPVTPTPTPLVTVAVTPPLNAEIGQLWWDADGGQLYVWVSDTVRWVATSPP